jgi:predicted cupin superfamily sugar epimerase
MAKPIQDLTASEVVALLGLKPHPEGGHYIETHLLGPEVTAGQRPQLIVPPFAWQAARSLGLWTLVGCTVAPAFEFAGFRLAPPGWEPGG